MSHRGGPADPAAAADTRRDRLTAATLSLVAEAAAETEMNSQQRGRK